MADTDMMEARIEMLESTINMVDAVKSRAGGVDWVMLLRRERDEQAARISNAEQKVVELEAEIKALKERIRKLEVGRVA